MAKSKNKIRVNFNGSNASSVTGSMAHIEMTNYEILLECGLYQSNNPKEDYKVNSTKFPFKAKNINYIFLSHAHIDHSGLIPKLFAQGCEGKIICPKGTKSLLKILLLDSAYIIGRDCEFLNKKYKMKATPYYGEDDVYEALKHIVEYDFNEVYQLTDDISFRFIPSGHIIASAQIELWLTEGNQTKKILYTGDLGNSIPKYYVTPFEPVEKANLAICESTYSDAARQVTSKDRNTDLWKIKTLIREVCEEKHGKVLFPTFSLDRTQNILTYLFDMFGHDEKFKIPIYLDSPLATKLTGAYLKLLGEDERKMLETALDWSNVEIIDTYEDSMALQKVKRPMIILAASGFMQAGRSRSWAKSILPDSKSQIVFIGFATEGSLAGKLRNAKTKTVSIDGKQYANRCCVTTLHSFSSHIQHDDMLKYYSDIICDKLCLVHGEYKAKCSFGKELQEEIFRKNKTNKVVVANKSTSLLI